VDDARLEGAVFQKLCTKQGGRRNGDPLLETPAPEYLCGQSSQTAEVLSLGLGKGYARISFWVNNEIDPDVKRYRKFSKKKEEKKI